VTATDEPDAATTSEGETAATDKTRTRVIRGYLPDRELHTTRVRGVGFRAECECGWKGKQTETMALARAEARWHAGQVHGR
jgi:hypothetical protein